MYRRYHGRAAMSAGPQSAARKIHVSLPEGVHRKLRIKCAIDDTSIQEYVSRLIERSVAGVKAEQGAASKKRS
jgi:predicted HicB family RNase H-like nuclease